MKPFDLGFFFFGPKEYCTSGKYVTVEEHNDAMDAKDDFYEAKLAAFRKKNEEAIAVVQTDLDNMTQERNSLREIVKALKIENSLRGEVLEQRDTYVEKLEAQRLSLTNQLEYANDEVEKASIHLTNARKHQEHTAKILSWCIVVVSLTVVIAGIKLYENYTKPPQSSESQLSPSHPPLPPTCTEVH